jgi:hypothetical protein
MATKVKKQPDPLSAIELGKFYDAIICEWNAERRNQGLAEISKETPIDLRGVRQILWRWLEGHMPADEAWPSLDRVDMVQGYRPIYDNGDGGQKQILSPSFEAQAQRNLNDMRFRWRANAILAEAFCDGVLQPMLASGVANVADIPCPQWVWLDARRGLRLAGSGSLGSDIFGESILEIDARHTVTTREKYHKRARIMLNQKSWRKWFETQFPEYVKRWPLSYESQKIVLAKQSALSDKGPDIETGSPLPDKAYVSLCEAVTWAATGYCRDESCMSDSLFADYSAISELTEHIEDKAGCPFDNVFLKIRNAAIEGKLEMWGRDGDDSYNATRSNNSLAKIDIALLMNYANQHWWKNIVFFGGGIGKNSSRCDVKVQRASVLALFPQSPVAINTASNQALQRTISHVSDAELNVWIDTRRNSCELMGVKATYDAANLHFGQQGKSVTRARVKAVIGSNPPARGRPKK